MRFLIYLILFYKLNVGIFLADIHACPESNSASFGSDNIFVRKGDPLKLCCNLTIDECNRTNTSDPLILKPLRARVTRTLSDSNVQLDPCNAEFETNHSDFSDGGTYICYKNSLRYPPLMRVNVFILASPSKPKDISVKYFERNSSLTIHFNPGRPSKQWLVDGFEVKLQNKIFSSLICLDPCKSNRSVSKICTCDYILNEEVLQLSQEVTVSVFRPSLDLKITSSQSRISFFPYEYVCPNPVSHLSFANVSSSDATILFQPSETTKRNIRKMDNHKRPLGFKILLSNSEESKQRFFLKLEFKKTVYKFSERINQNVAVIFQDLSPDTKYIASVVSFAGGGESESQVVHFTTNTSVPLLPPEIHGFSFSRAPFPTAGDNCLYVSWKPLAEEIQGGENLQYLYEIYPVESELQKRIRPKNSSVNYINVRLSNDSYIVRIWSENKIGRSDNYSEIIIPEYQEEDFVNVYVDLEKDVATVYVFLSEKYQPEALAIHWCVSQKSELCKTQDICQGLLRTPHITNLNGEKVFTFKVSLKASCKKLNYTKVTSVPYKDFEDEGDDMTETRTALAQIDTTEYRYSYSGIEEEVFEPCQENEAKAEDKEIVAPKSFFVSLKQSDRWMGMTPASCYYHTTAKTVDIKVTQSYNKDRKTVLTIEQRCDTQSDSFKSQQFLIKKFEIYHPVNSSCALKAKLLMQMKNNFSVSATFEPPSGLLQVCIVAIGNYTQYAILYDIEIDEVISETDINMVVGVVVSVLVLVPLAILCWIFSRKCRKSKLRFSDFKELHDCEDTLGNTHSSELKPLSEPNYSKKDSDSDSGRSSYDEAQEPCIPDKQSSEKPECGDSGLSQLDFVGQPDNKSERYSHHALADTGSNGSDTNTKSDRMSFGVDSGRTGSLEESDNLSSGSLNEGNSTSASSETSETTENGSCENTEDSSSSSSDSLNEGSNYAQGNFSFDPPSC